MVTVEELLLETLQRLGQEDFKAFRWRLHLLEIYSGFTPIPRYKLENGPDGNSDAVELAKTALGKMNMYDLVQKLSDRS